MHRWPEPKFEHPPVYWSSGVPYVRAVDILLSRAGQRQLDAALHMATIITMATIGWGAHA